MTDPSKENQEVIKKNFNSNHISVVHIENVLNRIILVFSIMSGIGLIATIFLYQRKTASLVIILAVLAAIIVAKLLIRSGHVRLSGIFIVSSLWIIFALLVLLGGGINNINVVFFISLTVIAGLLFGKRATFLTAGAGIAMSVGVVLLTIFDYLPSPYFMSSPLGNLMQFGFALVLTVSAINIALRDRDKVLDASHQQLSDRLAAEEALRKSEEKLRLITDNMLDCVALVDASGTYQYATPSYRETLGYSQEKMVGIKGFSLVHPDDVERIFMLYMEGFEKGWHQVSYETRLRHNDGHYVPAEIRARSLNDPQGKIIGGIISVRDITKQRQLEQERKRAVNALLESKERFRELSIMDGLTQLYNSRHFYARLKIELERSKRYEQPLTLLMLDLDDFKVFNDTYGHIEGDAVLSRLGYVIKRCQRETDIAFRYGGEEFTILLPMTTSADGVVIAERIRQEFKKESFSPKPGCKVHLTVSIGIGQYEPGEDIRAFVHRVDLLMYQGKKNGKDMVCPAA